MQSNAGLWPVFGALWAVELHESPPFGLHVLSITWRQAFDPANRAEPGVGREVCDTAELALGFGGQEARRY
jgi:hypothetical protein